MKRLLFALLLLAGCGSPNPRADCDRWRPVFYREELPRRVTYPGIVIPVSPRSGMAFPPCWAVNPANGIGESCALWVYGHGDTVWMVCE
jgi:hypothetical protein